MDNLADIYVDGYNRTPINEWYYKVSLKKNNDNEEYISLFTAWIGYEKGNEVRVADFVQPEGVCEDFRFYFKQNISVLEDITDLKVFLSIGGHALINKDLAQAHWPEIEKPKISVKQIYIDGYIDYSSLAPRYLQRRPLSTFRMEILARDKYRCRICGKHADDNEDVRLEIHHIQPWSEGGLTHPANLITLCKVCHEGVDVVDRHFLLDKVGVNLPPFGTHFIDLENPSLLLKQKMLFYDNNSVTIKLPKTIKTSLK